MKFSALFRAATVRLSLATLLAAATPLVRATVQIPAAAQPQLAATSDGRVWLAFGRGKEILVACSRDAGASFDAPVRVGELSSLALGMRRGPRIAARGNNVVITAMSGDFFAFRSSDGGSTWSAPVRINDIAGSTREGLHDLAVAPDGRLFAVWLDLRSKGTQLFSAESADSGATWSASRLVYCSLGDTICQCCHPSARFNARGDLAVMWRNEIDDHRDMWSAVRPAGARDFDAAAKLGQDTWPLKACPMDGGTIFTQDESFMTLWQRNGTVFLARPGEPELRLADGQQPVAVTTAHRAAAVWQQGPDLWSTPLGKQNAPTLLARSARFPRAHRCARHRPHSRRLRTRTSDRRGTARNRRDSSVNKNSAALRAERDGSFAKQISRDTVRVGVVSFRNAMSHSPTPSRHGALLLVAVAFWLISVALCSTRLVADEPHHEVDADHDHTSAPAGESHHDSCGCESFSAFAPPSSDLAVVKAPAPAAIAPLFFPAWTDVSPLDRTSVSSFVQSTGPPERLSLGEVMLQRCRPSQAPPLLS